MTVDANAKATAGTYTITFTNTITIATNGPTSNAVFTVTMANFQVIIVDPCLTTTITAPTLSFISA